MRQNSTSVGRQQNVNKLISSIIGAPNDLPALPIQNPNIFVHFYVRCAITVVFSNWALQTGNGNTLQK
jgi:hypothetical protein